MKKLNIAIVWNFSQPYLKAGNGHYILPSVRQYLLRDYIDMIQIANEYSGLKLNFNIVPALIEQILDYVNDRAVDFNLHLIKKEASILSLDEKEYIFNHFFKGEDKSIIIPNQRYHELYQRKLELVAYGNQDNFKDYFLEQDFRDLQVWHLLAWIGKKSRENRYIKFLFKKGKNFTEDEKARLLEFMNKQFRTIVDLYRESFTKSKIEISVTPYYNAVPPVMIDNHSIKINSKNFTLPLNQFIGKDLLQLQMLYGRRFFKRHFGSSPLGFISKDALLDKKSLEMVSRLRFDWTVLDSELVQLEDNSNYLFPSSYSHNDKYQLACFFYNDYLSKKIVEEYSKMPAEEAIKDFDQEIDKIIREAEKKNVDNDDAILVLYLPGDKIWDNYSGNGLEFLKHFYRYITKSKRLNSCRISDYLKKHSPKHKLGSVDLYQSTNKYEKWVGSPVVNRAWEKLTETKKFIDKVFEKGEISDDLQRKVRREFQKVLNADWFEWYSSADSKWDVYYDELFRSTLIRCYEMLYEKAPKDLFYNIKNESSEILKSKSIQALIHPDIDGMVEFDEEWQGAAIYDARQLHFSNDDELKSLMKYVYIGYDEWFVYIRIDFVNFPTFTSKIDLDIFQPNDITLSLNPLLGNYSVKSSYALPKADFLDSYALGDCLEMKIPIQNIGLIAGEIFAFQITIKNRSKVLERFPDSSIIKMTYLDQKVYK
jgi:alpha-amylase/alpha-mannosidase (GH57 family)